MEKTLLTYLMNAVIIILIITPIFVLFSATSQADILDEEILWGGQKELTRRASGFPVEKDPRGIVANIINIVLGFLGIIAVVIILLGGFKWMTSQGSEEKITEAKNLIKAGIIGLIIILASFAIASFVIRELAGVVSS